MTGAGNWLATSGFTADAVLSPYVYVFYASFLTAFLFTPLMRRLALHYGVVDQPDGIRKMHRRPVAYLGGLAVFLGWLAGLAISQFLSLHRAELGFPEHVVFRFGIVLAACIIVFVGLWDDVLGVRPWMKISGQIAAAGMLLADGVGSRVADTLMRPAISIFSGRLGLDWVPAGRVYELLVTVGSALMVVAVVVACCNATNLMDGLDGLCSGVTAIIAGGLLVICVTLAMFGHGFNTNWDAQRIVLALALLGAVLGFLPYNFNPASIFMGDTGSMFLGFCCATMLVMVGQDRPKWFLAGMVVFALPILDTALAFTRRWVNGRPLFSADKAHFHHQMVARGLSVRQTVFLSYALALCFALLGVAMVFIRTRFVVAVYMVVFGSIIVAAYKMGMVHERNGKTASAGEGAARSEGPDGVSSTASSTIAKSAAGAVSTGASAHTVGVKPATQPDWIDPAPVGVRG